MTPKEDIPSSDGSGDEKEGDQPPDESEGVPPPLADPSDMADVLLMVGPKQVVGWFHVFKGKSVHMATQRQSDDSAATLACERKYRGSGAVPGQGPNSTMWLPHGLDSLRGTGFPICKSCWKLMGAVDREVVGGCVHHTQLPS